MKIKDTLFGDDELFPVHPNAWDWAFPEDVPQFLTTGQEKALEHLKKAWELKKISPSACGIEVRTNPLFVAPSGVGKSFIIKNFCKIMSQPKFRS